MPRKVFGYVLSKKPTLPRPIKHKPLMKIDAFENIHKDHSKYKSEASKKLSIQQYFKKIKPYLC